MRWGSCVAMGLAGALCSGAMVGAAAATLSVAVTGVDGDPVHDVVVVAEPRSEERPPLPARAAAPATVDQRGKEFHPWVSAVYAGTSIIFANHDDITHHVYSFSRARQFSFRLQADERRGPLVFPRPGVVVVGCNIHDWMIAYIYVSDSPWFSRTGKDGRARIEDLPAGDWRLTIWHPGVVDAAQYARNLTVTADRVMPVQIRLRKPLTETGPRPPLDNAGYL